MGLELIIPMGEGINRDKIIKDLNCLNYKNIIFHINLDEAFISVTNPEKNYREDKK